MSVRSPFRSLHDSLTELEKRAGDQVRIHQLRFPEYKNIARGETLPFSFPITALLGQNGTNKSSVLHAIYGSLKNRSIGEYWFETQLDAIPEVRDGLKQSVCHTYKKGGGQLVECIKSRAPRGEADPDYWEAVKPTTPYGFPLEQERVSPLDAHVVHLDFRAELPAHDKYFYFPDGSHLSMLAKRAKDRGTLRRAYRKQDYLRQRSGEIKGALDTDGRDLSKQELEAISYILSREYRHGRIVEHTKLRGHTGRTIRFTSRQYTGGYTDAFAGSGESAAAFLVIDAMHAPDRSIILLDEPETSLHPQAQQRTLEFLCHQAVEKRLQVVISTHSPYFTERLPQSAIRVFLPRADGRITISDSHSVAEALHTVADISPGRAVFVEDKRALALLQGALQQLSPQTIAGVDIRVRPGGTSRFFRDIYGLAATSRKNVFLVLDGDHKPSTDLPADDEIPRSRRRIEELVREFTKGPNSKGPSVNFADDSEAVEHLKFLRDRVLFLPGSNPEALVWDVDALSNAGIDVPHDIDAEVCAKRRIELIAEYNTGMDADAVFRILLRDLVVRKVNQHPALGMLIERLR